MAKFSAQDFVIEIAGTDFSSSLAAVTLDVSREQLEVTSFSDSARRYIAGLQDASVTFSFHQDFATGSVDETLWSNLGGTVAVTITPSGTVTSSSPQYQFNALVTSTQPYASNVGDLATMDVTWPVDGAITRATA